MLPYSLSFLLSSFFASLSLSNPSFSFIFFCLLLLGFFLPIDIVFILSLIVRLYAFDEWGIALFMQITFLYVLIKVPRTFFLSLYILLLLMLSMLRVDEILIAKYILFPLAGALAIFFLFKAVSGKDHFFSSILYVVNGLCLLFLFNNTEAAVSFIHLNLFVLLFFFIISYISIIKKNLFLRKFPEELNFIVYKGKDDFFFIFYGIISLLLTIYSYDEWMKHSAASLILQVGFIKILAFYFSISKKG